MTAQQSRFHVDAIDDPTTGNVGCLLNFACRFVASHFPKLQISNIRRLIDGVHRLILRALALALMVAIF